MSEEYEYKTIRYVGGRSQDQTHAYLTRQGWELIDFAGRLCSYRRKVSDEQRQGLL